MGDGQKKNDDDCEQNNIVCEFVCTITYASTHDTQTHVDRRLVHTTDIAMSVEATEPLAKKQKTQDDSDYVSNLSHSERAAALMQRLLVGFANQDHTTIATVKEAWRLSSVQEIRELAHEGKSGACGGPRPNQNQLADDAVNNVIDTLVECARPLDECDVSLVTSDDDDIAQANASDSSDTSDVEYTEGEEGEEEDTEDAEDEESEEGEEGEEESEEGEEESEESEDEYDA